MASQATATNNEGANVLERLIDSISVYRDLFDDVYFPDFNDAAQEIDSIEGVMQSRISELEDDNKELKLEIEELKNQLEELQNDN